MIKRMIINTPFLLISTAAGIFIGVVVSIVLNGLIFDLKTFDFLSSPSTNSLYYLITYLFVFGLMPLFLCVFLCVRWFSKCKAQVGTSIPVQWVKWVVIGGLLGFSIITLVNDGLLVFLVINRLF